MSPLLLVATAMVAAPAATAAPAANCGELLPTDRAAVEARPVTPEDLVRLRDIGPVDAASRASPIVTLSPDGKQAAFQIRRADSRANGYCLAMVVVDVGPGARPRIVDRGGDILLMTLDARGHAEVATGIMLAITPRWSADGRWIAFLKREGGRTRVWRAQADGSASHPLTDGAGDVTDFRLTEDGKAVVYATRPGLEAARADAEREGLRGWRYDDRFAPSVGIRPLPAASAGREAHVVDLTTGASRLATLAEAALVGASDPQPASAKPPSLSAADLEIATLDLSGGAAPGALHARLADGRIVACSMAACERASDPWWMPGRRRVRFFRREGWSLASTAIYEWDLRQKSVRRLYVTDDLLADCTPTDVSLICLRESSLQPRRLERLHPATGRRELLFDPNPEFAALQKGAVERLHWRNAFGLEALGDLVRPVGYRSGKLYPLVVVQYDTRGFLRGGTGDEYPIQAFAARGYAVLSVRRPMSIGLARGGRTFQEVNRLDLQDFADRRSALDADEAGVRIAIEWGVADPTKIGITGLSDGATQVISALIGSRMFAAAAISTCCIDTMLAARAGPATARDFREAGFPLLTDRNDTFWKNLSLSLNARRIRTPILLQLADGETLNALESYTALREAGVPVDMFVFPGEHHIKWQPAHRLAVYQRAIDWFDYWLSGVRSNAPERQAELASWDSMRASQVSHRP